MSVISNSLMNDEEILERAMISFDQVKYKAIMLTAALTIFYLSQTFLTIIAVLSFIPAALLIVYTYMQYASVEVALTNQRIIAKHGYFSHRVDSIAWNKVESVSMYQGWLGRKLNYGVIRVSGVGGEVVAGGFLENPNEFRKSAIALIPA